MNIKAISTICFLFTVLGCLGNAGQATAGGGGENMLLVVNPNDPASLQIANAYAAFRNIPSNNILFIAPPATYHNDGNPISQADVTSTYLNPSDPSHNIAQQISARGLTNQINYIGTIGQAVSYSITGQISSALSLNYALTLLTPLTTTGSGLNLNNSAKTYSYSVGNLLYATPWPTGLYQDPANIPVPSISNSSSWSITPDAPVTHAATYQSYYPYLGSGSNYATQYFMSGTIGYTGANGNTVGEVIASLQSAAASDGSRPAGTVYFENSLDPDCSGPRMPEWPVTIGQLNARGILSVSETSTTPQNRNNVLGAVVGAATMTLPNNSTYLPGSWADNLTSYGCYFPDTGQTKATKFIAAGASGTTGSVIEPYNIPERFTNSSIYTFIADGCTLGEALAKSVASPDIQMPLGDMLAQPSADVPKVAFTASPGNYGSARGTISIGASAGLTFASTIATGISRLELLVDGTVSSSGTLAGGSGTFNLNTVPLSDGVHEIRIVGINNSQAASEGYAAQQIVVNNHGRSVNFNGGSLTLTSSAATIGLAAVAGNGTVSQIELTCLGRMVAQASGSPGALSLSPSALAPGDNVIVPVAIFSDGSHVAGGAFVVHVESGTVNGWGNGGNTGLWSNPSNWTAGSLPQNGDKVARFGGSANGVTVTLDASASIEEIEFNISGGSSSYTIAASTGQALTLSSTNGSGSQCLINVLNGKPTISAPLVLATAGNLVTVTNPADSLTVSGAVSGGGSLTKTGNGLLTLSGSNSYTGVTTVSAGTLQIDNGGSAGILMGNITNNGVLVFNRSDNPTFGSIISGSGSLTQTGASILTLTGSNSFNGTTTISTGTLQIGNGGTSGSLVGNITDNAVLMFNRSDNLTFGGAIGGSGSLIQTGKGILTLTGTNTYSGGTTVSSGTLAITSPAALPYGALKVGSGGVFLFDPSLLYSPPLAAGSLDISSLALDGGVSAISPSLTVGSAAVYPVATQSALSAVPEPDALLLLLAAGGGGLLWHLRLRRENSSRKRLARK